MKAEEFTKARIVGYTQPSEEFKHLFSDIKDLIVYCGRVSNPSNQGNMETADKLIKYLLKHKHFSVFETASITLEVETPRDCGRQLLRHRSFTFQEFSNRYQDPTKYLGFITREARLQDTNNRQNSIKTDDDVLQAEWEALQKEVIAKSQEVYDWAITQGIAKEQARVVLPEGLIMSRLYIQGTVRSWIHYLDVRLDESTQLEHRVLAMKIAEAIGKIFTLPERT